MRVYPVTSLFSGSISKVQVKRGVRFQADFRLAFPDDTPTVKSSRRFKTEREAKAFLKDKETEHSAEILRRQNPEQYMLFKDLCTRYAAAKNNHCKQTTIENRDSLIESRILPFFSGKVVSQITPDDVEQWHCTLKSRNYSDTYLRAMHSRLSAVFNYAIENGWIKSNPAKRNSIGKKNAPERQVWTLEQYSLFRHEMEIYPEPYYAFEVLYFTGIRMGELFGITLRDINFDTRTLSINKQVQHIEGQDVIMTTKTAQSVRTISLPGFLCDELQDYIDTLSEHNPDTRLFTLLKYKLNYYLREGIKLTGLPKITVHCFRHSHITNLIQAGFSPMDIAKRVGHESIYITLHYAHSFKNMDVAIANKLDDQYASMATSGGANNADGQ